MLARQSTHQEPLVVHCADCQHEWAIGFMPMSIETINKLAKSRCPFCGSERVMTGPVAKPTAAGDAYAWLSNGDTGTSSLTIWHALMGRTPDRTDVPHDPADFGRCYRLLQVMPSWKDRLSEVAALYPKWSPLVSAWNELTALYEEERPSGRAPKLYARMHELNNGFHPTP